MPDTDLAEKLAFLRAQRAQDDAVLLAEAVREGIGVLYREALIQANLLGQVPRSRILEELDPDELAAIEFQRDALRRDLDWGVAGAGSD